MSDRIIKNRFVLLPRYFKTVGLFLVMGSLALGIIRKLAKIELPQSKAEVIFLFFLNAIVLGLFFISWSRDKIEDELTGFIRLKALAITCIITVLYIVFIPAVDLIFKFPIYQTGGRMLIIEMLLLYLVIYYLQKAGR